MLTIALMVSCTAEHEDLDDPADRWSDAADFDDEPSAFDELVDSIDHQTPEQAHDADVRLAAQQLGLSESLVAQKLDFQREFAEYAEQLAARYPERIEAIWLEPLPEIGGHVRFVGEVPVDAEPNEAWLTRMGSGRVELSGDGTAPWREHVRHAELAALALADAGHVNHLTYFDPASGHVVVEMKRPAGETAPDRATVTRLTEDRIVEATASGDPRLGLTSREEISAALDIELALSTGEGPIFELQAGRGGNVVRDDGVFECTSGWSVFGSEGFGMLTAGHCSGINELLETNGTVIDLFWLDQINGAAGDVEYHWSGSPVVAEFYADASSIRDVSEYWTGIELWGITFLYTGDSVCQYGRASNFRSCNKTITATGVSVTFTDGITRGNLVRTDNNTGIPGDSGGGWSWGTTAYGTHVGGSPGGGNSYFTPLVVAADELGVIVLTK